MDQPTENVCCRKLGCVTNLEAFETIVLDDNVLSGAIISCSDIYADDPEYTHASYRKLHIYSTPCKFMDIWVAEIDK